MTTEASAAPRVREYYTNTAYGIIKKMATRISALYEQKLGNAALNVGPSDLPEALDKIVVEGVEKLSHKKCIRRFEEMLVHPDRNNYLKEQYKEYFQGLYMTDDSDCLKWSCVVLIGAEQLKSREFACAPQIAIDTIYEIFEENDRLGVFTTFCPTVDLPDGVATSNSEDEHYTEVRSCLPF